MVAAVNDPEGGGARRARPRGGGATYTWNQIGLDLAALADELTAVSF